MMKTKRNTIVNKNNSLRLNFQFDIDNSKKLSSTILYFPPLSVKYDEKNKELTIRAKDSHKFLIPILNKIKTKSLRNSKESLISFTYDNNKRSRNTSPVPKYHYSKGKRIISKHFVSILYSNIIYKL
jgi:hypothetical protein